MSFSYAPLLHEVKTEPELLIRHLQFPSAGILGIAAMLNLGVWLWDTWCLFLPLQFTHSASLSLERQLWDRFLNIILDFASDLQRLTCQCQTSKVTEGDIVLFTGGPLGRREASLLP